MSIQLSMRKPCGRVPKGAGENELVEEYMPYAASLAKRVWRGLPAAVDYDDILSSAREGLLDAARRFDGSQDVDFKTFTHYRIKGAIYDGLRKSGWLPRRLYAKVRSEGTASGFPISLGKSNDMEIADVGSSGVERRAELVRIMKNMRDSIGALPERERHLILMYYFQNKTLEEIGEKLGLSKSWTSRLHARALSNLFSDEW